MDADEKEEVREEGVKDEKGDNAVPEDFSVFLFGEGREEGDGKVEAGDNKEVVVNRFFPVGEDKVGEVFWRPVGDGEFFDGNFPEKHDENPGDGGDENF